MACLEELRGLETTFKGLQQFVRALSDNQQSGACLIEAANQASKVGYKVPAVVWAKALSRDLEKFLSAQDHSGFMKLLNL